MKIGIVDVGGGMRGIYGAGVMDTCLDEGIRFDLGIGVSAGSANLSSFLAGQRERNYRFYHEYAFRKEYMGLDSFFKTRSFINFDYVFNTLSAPGGEDPIDWDALQQNPAEFLIVATDAQTGAARYFTKEDMAPGRYEAMAASCCLPGIDRPVNVYARPCFDGALSDSVPIEKAFAEGCDRVVLVLTKPLSVRRVPGKDGVMAKMIAKEYPEAAQGLMNRADYYNSAVDKALEYEKEGRALILAPADISGVDTLKRDKAALDRLYQLGIEDGKKIGPWLRGEYMPER